MYFPNDDMKVNKFRLVYVPKNRDYMSRVGAVTAPPSSFSGEEPVHRALNKVDDLEYYARYAQMMDEKNE